MSNRWNSKAFRKEAEELERQMHPATIRTKCYAESLITMVQKNELARLHDAEHNRELLAMLEIRKDDDYDVFCEILLTNDTKLHHESVARMRPASGAVAASAPTHGYGATASATGRLEGNPFETQEYKLIRMELSNKMGMTEVRNAADGYGLITSIEADNLSTTYVPKGRAEHNRELFREMEAGGVAAIRKFSNSVLPTLGQCATHKPALDTVLAKYK